jgi:amino acid adenylation domain-containing protein
MSPPQRRLWLELAKRGAADRDSTLLSALVLRLSGPVLPELVRLACTDVVARHPALRTRLTDVGTGLPEQLLSYDPAAAFAWSVRPPLTGTAEEFAERLLGEPLTLLNSPLSAAALAPLPEPDEWVFAWAFHHLVVDGWSLDLVARDLGDAYAARAAGGPPPAPDDEAESHYLDLLARSAAAETTDAHQAHVDYWQDILAAQDHHDQVAQVAQTGDMGVRRAGFDFGDADRAALAAVADLAATSPLVGVLALYELVLSRWFGHPGPLVAMPVLGRTEDSENSVGCFATVLPIGCEVDERLSFADLVDRLSDRFFDAVDHAVQFDLITARTGVDVRFAVVPAQADAVAATTWHDVMATRVHDVVGARAHFDLVLRIESGQTGLMLLADAGRWTDDALAAFRDELRDAATRCLTRPDDALLTLVERPAAASVPRRSPSAEPRPVVDLPRLFAQRGDRPAVSCDGEVWTYRQLADASRWLADRLTERGVGPRDRVAVVLGRAPWQVAAAVGIMAAGAVYMPCDPTSVGRTKAALAHTPHALVVTEAAHRALAGDGPVLELAPTPPATGGATPWPTRLTGPAYVIHTSGSTGRPKAVEVHHDTLAGTIADGIAAGDLTGDDVVSAHCSAGFDASLWEWLPVLAVGGRLALMPDEVKNDPVRVWRWAADEGVTVTLLTTSLLMQAMIEAPATHPTYRLLQTGAEAMTGHPPAAPCPIVNVYGPTEGGVTATAGALLDARPHIGTVLPNATVYLLDEWLRPLRPGGVGQIYIGGGREANGYVGAPGETARVFVPDPYGKPGGRMYATGDYAWLEPDGVVMYRGRRDDQVKIRGVRIEIGEVETAVETHSAVRSAVCVVTGKPALHVFYTGVPTPTRDLRKHLRGRLSSAALPATFTHLDSLPISVNGKADRRALTARAEAQAVSAVHEPGSGRADVIAGLWCDALGLPHVNDDADFFELGGDSLIAARLCARIGEQLDVHVPLVTMFQVPILRDFRADIEARVAARTAARAAQGVTP